MDHADRFVQENGGIVEKLFDRIDTSYDNLITRIREIAEIPAPTFHEERRTQFLEKAFSSAGLKNVRSLDRGSVLGFTKSKNESGTLLLAAHIDTVFPEGTDLTTRIEDSILFGPGTGDNATNVAAILTLAELLDELEIPLTGNVAFCGTVREEGNGNLDGIAEVMDFLDGKLATVIGVDGGSSSVVNRSLAIRRYLLKVICPGGHSWGQFGKPTAIHEMAHIINLLASVEVPDKPKTTYNVGTIRGGTAVNALAQECEAEIDLRSLHREIVEALEQRLLEIADSVRTPDVNVKTELIGSRPAAVLAPESLLADIAVSAARHLGSEVKLAASSTDAALALWRGYPAISFGIYRGGSGHTLEEFVELDSITSGLKWLALTVLMLAGVKQ